DDDWHENPLGGDALPQRRSLLAACRWQGERGERLPLAKPTFLLRRCHTVSIGACSRVCVTVSEMRMDQPLPASLRRLRKRRPSYAWALHARESPHYRQLSGRAKFGLDYARELAAEAAYRGERALRGE